MSTILIAEDEQLLRDTLVAQCKKFNYTVFEAKDGAEALKLFRSKKPDLILLDVVMPKKNGIEVLEEIRIKNKSTTPVIIVSNLDQPQDLETAKNLSIQGYFVKANISLHELSSKINSLLAAQKS